MAQAQWLWHRHVGTGTVAQAQWLVTHFWSIDICVYSTIIHYEPLVGGSAINCGVGVFDTGALAQAQWHWRIKLIGYGARAVGEVCWKLVFTEDDIVWISFFTEWEDGKHCYCRAVILMLTQH